MIYKDNQCQIRALEIINLKSKIKSMVDVKIEPSWKELLQDEFEKPYFSELIQFVKNEYKTTKIYPPGKLIFNAFDHCPAEQTKVVILGQDPYHGPGQAHGLCFSVPEGIEQPPSLQNIFKEREKACRRKGYCTGSFVCRTLLCWCNINKDRHSCWNRKNHVPLW